MSEIAYNCTVEATEITSSSTIEIGSRGRDGIGISGIVHERLSGIQNSTNLVFTTSLPIKDGTEWIYTNGIPQKRGEHYLVSGVQEIQFMFAPRVWWDLQIIYEEQE